MNIIKIIILSMLLYGCSMCGNDPINVDISPNGEKNAVAFIRGCGATTGYSTHVSITNKTGNLHNVSGNVFTIEGKLPISVKWVSNIHLIIKVNGHGKELKKMVEHKGIKIEYQ